MLALGLPDPRDPFAGVLRGAELRVKSFGLRQALGCQASSGTPQPLFCTERQHLAVKNHGRALRLAKPRWMKANDLKSSTKASHRRRTAAV